jgi:hypothetical protein
MAIRKNTIGAFKTAAKPTPVQSAVISFKFADNETVPNIYRDPAICYLLNVLRDFAAVLNPSYSHQMSCRATSQRRSIIGIRYINQKN